MAKEIGVSFLIGATLGASVATAFSGLQERIKATQEANVYRKSAAEVEAMQQRLAGQIVVTESRLKRGINSKIRWAAFGVSLDAGQGK